MAKENPEIKGTFFLPTAKTFTPDGTNVEGILFAADDTNKEEAIQSLGESLGAKAVTLGNKTYERDTSTSTSVGLGGTKWRASWNPAGGRYGEIAKAAQRAKITGNAQYN